jgi:signal transduction histidine kinase
VTAPKDKPTGRHTPPKGAKNLEDAASKALLAGDSGTAPPPEGVIQLAEIFSLALASLRRPLEVAASRFEDLQRGVPKNSPVADGVKRARGAVFEAKRLLDSLHLLARPAKAPETVEAGAVVTTVVSAMKGVFTTDTTDIMEFVAPNLPKGIARPLALRYALLNLIASGLRGCGGAGMVRVLARASDRGGFEVEVSDDGPGIAKEERETIFDPTEEEAGRRSGLALHLAYRLAERARVEITLSDRPKGAAFILTVPPLAK